MNLAMGQMRGYFNSGKIFCQWCSFYPEIKTAFEDGEEWEAAPTHKQNILKFSSHWVW